MQCLLMKSASTLIFDIFINVSVIITYLYISIYVYIHLSIYNLCICDNHLYLFQHLDTASELLAAISSFSNLLS